jgi:ubiquinone biosynthesis monooxygenase Coq7
MHTSSERHYNALDAGIQAIDTGLRTLFKIHHAGRPNPAATIDQPHLTKTQQQQAAGYMRVNHAGEIAAQALYQGQALGARSNRIKQAMQQAADEEVDHLVWCEQRLQELNSHTSYFAPVWYTGALAIGTLAGMISDGISLGFLAETEKQVVRHLETHLVHLPENDHKSRAIVKQMQIDENHHADTAIQHGAVTLPKPVKKLMQYTAKIMTSIAYYV